MEKASNQTTRLNQSYMPTWSYPSATLPLIPTPLTLDPSPEGGRNLPTAPIPNNFFPGPSSTLNFNSLFCFPITMKSCNPITTFLSCPFVKYPSGGLYTFRSHKFTPSPKVRSYSGLEEGMFSPKFTISRSMSTAARRSRPFSAPGLRAAPKE